MKIKKIISLIILLLIPCVAVTLIFTAMCANVWGLIPDELAFKIIVTAVSGIFVPVIIFILYGIYTGLK